MRAVITTPPGALLVVFRDLVGGVATTVWP